MDPISDQSYWGLLGLLRVPRGSKYPYLRTLFPKTIPLMAFGTRVRKYWVLGPLVSMSAGPIALIRP